VQDDDPLLSRALLILRFFRHRRLGRCHIARDLVINRAAMDWPIGVSITRVTASHSDQPYQTMVSDLS